MIVPVKDDKRLIDLIKALEKQTFKDFEVLIADSSKERIFKGMTKLKMKYFHTKPLTIAESLMYLAKKASANIIAITESDCVPNEKWLEDLVSEYEDENTIIVGSQDIISPYVEVISFASLLVPKEAFKVKMSKRLRVGEDTDWFMTLKTKGFKFKKINKALVMHYKDPLKRLFRSFEYARSHAFIYVKHKKEERIVKSIIFQLLQSFYSLLTAITLFIYWCYYRIKKVFKKELE